MNDYDIVYLTTKVKEKSESFKALESIYYVCPYEMSMESRKFK